MKCNIRKYVGLFLLTFTVIGFSTTIKAQQIQYEFTYDDAGNRIKREVVFLNNKRDTSQSSPTLTEYTKTSDTDSKEQILKETTSLKGYDYVVFPNPTTSSVMLQITKDFQKGNVQLLSLSGGVVYKSANVTSGMEIDLSSEPAGHYILKLDLDGTSVKEWIIIKEE